MRLSTLRCCRMCCSAWSTPIRRSSAGSKPERHRAIRASRGGAVTTPSPIPRPGTTGCLIGQWVPRRVQDWADCRAVESSAGRHLQDCDDLEGGGWLVRLLLVCQGAHSAPPLTGRETGIDVGLKVFLVTAEGEAIENPRHY